MEIVVDGTDGAGKTTCVDFVVERLRRRGLPVTQCAPYREKEVYHLWESSPERAARIIVGVMSRFRSAHPDDVIVWDRGWPTAFVTTDHALARSMFMPLPDLTILLLGTIEQTRANAQHRGAKGVWVTDDALLRTYNRAYHRLQEPSGHVMLRCYPGDSSLFDFGPVAQELLDRLELAGG